ncbi:MAG: DMT family transporter [Chlorobi bacterium]|nr:DMT family transporter [Chlorobiota bacterium]
MESPSHRQAILFLTAAALLWSSGGVLIKLAEWSPIGIASVRSAIAALVIGGMLARQRGQLPRLLPSSLLGWSAAVGYAGTVVLFVWATKLTSAANAIVLQYSSPLYVAVAGHLICGEKVRPIEWVLLAIMLVGIVLFFAEQLSPAGMLGNAIAAASGVAMAVMTLSVRYQRQGSALDALVTGNVLAALIGIGTWSDIPTLPPGTLGTLLLLGVVQLGLPYILFVRALSRVRAIEAVMLTMIEPIANPIWVMLATDERPSVWSLAGGGLVLSATVARALLTYWGSFDAASADPSSGSSGGTSSPSC